jgi:hypothetical protein
MNLSDIINTGGVSLILLAFLLLQMKKVQATDTTYLLLNFLGAGLAAVGSYLIPSWPFVILEIVWAGVAAWGLVGKMRGN